MGLQGRGILIGGMTSKSIYIVLYYKTKYTTELSAFQGADHNALNEMLLEKWVCEQNRERGENNHGVLQLYGRQRTLYSFGDLVHGNLGKIYGVFNQNTAQVQRQGLQVGIGQIYHVMEPAVPCNYDGVDGYDRQNWFGKGA